MNRGPVVVRSQRLLARLSHTVSGHVASRLLSVVARAVAGSIAGRVARCAHSRAVGRRARGDDRRQVDDRYTTVSKHDTVIDSAYVANMVLTYATRRGDSAGVARCFGVRAACASAPELVARAQPQPQAQRPGTSSTSQLTYGFIASPRETTRYYVQYRLQASYRYSLYFRSTCEIRLSCKINNVNEKIEILLTGVVKMIRIHRYGVYVRTRLGYDECVVRIRIVRGSVHMQSITRVAGSRPGRGTRFGFRVICGSVSAARSC